MLARVYSAVCVGLDVVTVTVETDVSPGISFYLVGLPDSSVRESRQRIAVVLSHCGYRIPGRKIIINLAPGDIKKVGTSFDLPMALGILSASGQIRAEDIESFVIMGELALDGSLRPCRGVLPVAMHAVRSGFFRGIFPIASAGEAAEVEGLEVYGASSFKDVLDILSGRDRISFRVERGRMSSCAFNESSCTEYADFSDIVGHAFAKRAVETAVSGGHNILLCGSPGSGKSMLASAVRGILPPLSKEESVECTMIYSVAGEMPAGAGLMTSRPFRAPHHSATRASLIGGGRYPVPGEISLAHNGVLFLDEMPEFRRDVLEALRQPLETRHVQISRSACKTVFPSSFMLVATMNPCPCGYSGDGTGRCMCPASAVSRYFSRISGPMLDRFDMFVRMDSVNAGSFLDTREKPENSSSVLSRVCMVRKVQSERFSAEGIHVNSGMAASALRRYCMPDASASSMLAAAGKRLNLSVRAVSCILKVARTIADMEGSEKVLDVHVAEALSYRVPSV